MKIEDITRSYVNEKAAEFRMLEHIWTDLGESPWGPQHFEMDLPGKWGLSYVAREDEGGCMIGYLIGSLATDSRSRVNKIIVSTERRVGGVGSTLLDHFERTSSDIGCDEVELKALVTNDAANRFYIKHGYRVIDNIVGTDGRMRFLYFKELR